MKNDDDPRLLERKQSIDRERRAQAVLKARQQQRIVAAAMERVAKAKIAPKAVTS